MEDIDDRVRAAMKALDDRAPGGIADEHEHDFAAKVEARLARVGDDMETSTEGTGTNDAADGVPPRIDDSGLHDIKALAKTTRQRVSRRITSQHDIDEQLLSSSSSGLNMVALPEPAKLVALPSVEEIAAAPETSSAVARAAHKVAARSQHAPRRRAVWIGGAVVAAAASVLGVVMIKGGSRDERPSTAAEPTSGAGSSVAAMAPRQELAGAPTPPQTKQADHTTVAANSALDTQAALAPGAVSGSAAAAGSGSAAFEMTPTTTGTADTHEPKTAPGHHDHTIGSGAGNGSTTKTDVNLKKDGKVVKGGKPAPGGSGKSLDDLIDEAAGGSGETKKPSGGGDTKPTLDKKELTSQDIRSAMGSVTKRAQACYDKFNQAGTVGVKASVAPSGAITKVTITGAFAGTPTGDCVASVVQGVSFPAWDGAPMTVNYSYLLSE